MISGMILPLGSFFLQHHGYSGGLPSVFMSDYYGTHPQDIGVALRGPLKGGLKGPLRGGRLKGPLKDSLKGPLRGGLGLRDP